MLSGYTILRELGRGGMGRVYAIRHPRWGVPVALKTCVDVSLESLERFQREGELLARIRHPNVVGVHAIDPIAGGMGLVMELVEGKPLSEVAPCPPLQAVWFVTEIGRAVACLHEHGLLHRDLKPENVMLTADGRPVLVDFGLAMDVGVDRLTQTGVVMGTPGFMAPEQVRAHDVDERTDVYGLAALLYALITGDPPFSAPTAVACLQCVVKDVPDFDRLREAPAWVRAICARGLAKSPGERYPSVADFVQALERRARGGRVLSRRVALWGAAGTLLLAAVAALSMVGAQALRAPADRPPKEGPAPTPQAGETPAAETGLRWRLQPGETLRYRLERKEELRTEGSVMQVDWIAELVLDVESVEGGRAQVRLCVEDIVVTLRPEGSLTEIRYTKDSDTYGAPCRPLRGAAFVVQLDLSTGATHCDDLKQLDGWRAAFLKKVNQEKDSALYWDGDWGHAVTTAAMATAVWTHALDTLLHVLPGDDAGERSWVVESPAAQHGSRVQPVTLISEAYTRRIKQHESVLFGTWLDPQPNQRFPCGLSAPLPGKGKLRVSSETTFAEGRVTKSWAKCEGHSPSGELEQEHTAELILTAR